MITFYVLDLITKTWNQELYNEDCVVTGGHSHLLIDEFLIIFGGQSPDGVVHNQLFIYNCELKTVYRVAYKGTQIPPRCHALMAKIDKDKIIIAGGRSILYIPYQEKIDAYHLEFSDEMRAATVTPLEVETNPVWPTQMYTNAMVGDKIVVVSNPSDMTNIKIPGPWLRSFVTEKRDLARSDIVSGIWRNLVKVTSLILYFFSSVSLIPYPTTTVTVAKAFLVFLSRPPSWLTLDLKPRMSLEQPHIHSTSMQTNFWPKQRKQNPV